MKFGILFVILFSLLTTATGATYHNKDTPIKCEEYFRVSACDECQKEIWNYWSNPSTCGFFINLLKNVMEKVAHTHDDSYNLALYTEAFAMQNFHAFTKKQNHSGKKLRKNVLTNYQLLLI